MAGAALQHMIAVQSALTGVRAAAAALGLGPRELLHAGPPLRDPCQPPAVLLSSAVMTILHEGWAGSEDEAEKMIATGHVTLAPAQPRGCVTPLACVVSPGMPLFVVEADGHRVHAPVSAVRGPDTRMGFRDPALAARLRRRDQYVAPGMRGVLAQHGALPLLPLAAHGLAHGDDLHSRTAAANAMFAGWLRAQGAVELAVDIEATPLFFLTLWMAASALMLRSIEGGDEPSLVTRAGGNGESFGIALAGAPQHWTRVEATPPHGRPMGGRRPLLVSPAIGDSAVIDMFGCGGLALADAPEPLDAFAGYLPHDHASFPERLLCVRHGALGRHVGLDARKVVSEQCPPLVALAMLAADGGRGFAGRGLYRPSLALFERALASLA